MLQSKRCQIEFIRIIKHILSQPGRGKWYKGNPQPSSAKGHPPASQTGNLLASWGVIRPIQVLPRGVKGDINQKSIGTAIGASPVRYAIWLEFGTKHMKKRPFVSRAQDSAEKWLNQYITHKSMHWFTQRVHRLEQDARLRDQEFLRNLSSYTP